MWDIINTAWGEPPQDGDVSDGSDDGAGGSAAPAAAPLLAIEDGDDGEGVAPTSAMAVTGASASHGENPVASNGGGDGSFSESPKDEGGSDHDDDDDGIMDTQPDSDSQPINDSQPWQPESDVEYVNNKWEYFQESQDHPDEPMDVSPHGAALPSDSVGGRVGESNTNPIPAESVLPDSKDAALMPPPPPMPPHALKRRREEVAARLEELRPSNSNPQKADTSNLRTAPSTKHRVVIKVF